MSNSGTFGNTRLFFVDLHVRGEYLVILTHLYPTLHEMVFKDLPVSKLIRDRSYEPQPTTQNLSLVY